MGQGHGGGARGVGLEGWAMGAGPWRHLSNGLAAQNGP